MTDENIRIDKIKWYVYLDTNNNRVPQPICPIHHLRMRPVPPKYYDSFYRSYRDGYIGNATKLECQEGPHHIDIPRTFDQERIYVIDRIDAKIFKKMKTINLDDEAVLLVEDELKSKDGKYFINSRLVESKRGKQLVIYAGEKGKREKSQIFVEPEVKRLDFDRNDIHPDEVFAEVTAKFRDGSSHSIKKDVKK